MLTQGNSPLRILAKQYAHSLIDKQEYIQRRTEILDELSAAVPMESADDRTIRIKSTQPPPDKS